MEDIKMQLKNKECEKPEDTQVPQADDERMNSNVDAIAAAIMEALDAVDAEEGSRITSIMIEIGLE